MVESMKEKSPITSHVLDTQRGKPAMGVPLHLEREEGKAWKSLGKGITDADGRVETLLAPGQLAAGIYRLTFTTRAYFEASGQKCFYPEVAVVFEVAVGGGHYHIPLLLAAHGYTTYRGS